MAEHVTRMGRRQFALAATVAVSALAAAGCGVLIDDGARPVAGQNAPFGLLAPAPAPLSTTTTASP